jgi:mxaA protein
LQSLHRAIDATRGRSVLSDDLAEFLLARPEFCSLQPSFERFFSASKQAFFGNVEGSVSKQYDMAELARFAKELGDRERAA